MKKLTVLCLSVLLLFNLIVSSSCFNSNAEKTSSNEKIQLSLKMEKGDVKRVKNIIKQDISQEVMGMQQEMTQNTTLFYQYKVTEKNAGNMTVEVLYERVQMYQENQAGVVEYDSDNPPEVLPDAAVGYAAIVGKSFTIEITSKGKVTKVNGIDEMINDMIEEMELDAQNREQVKELMKNQFGEEAMRGTMENMMAIYPDEKVGINDTWDREFTNTMMIPIQVNNHYKLTDIQSNNVLIDVNSEINSIEGDDTFEVAGMVMKYDLKGTQSGKITVDRETGWTNDSEIKQKMNGTITVTGEMMGEEGMSWPITINTTIKNETIE